MIKKLLLSLMLVSTASMGHVYAKNNVTLQGKGDAMLTVEQQPAQMPYADPGCVTHVVTFMNGGVILKQYAVCEGEVPVYDGPTPEKAATKEHVYSFDGWDKELQPVGNSDITYNAMFSESTRKYTIRFYDEDGTTLLSEKEVEYGQFPTYTEPTKPSTPEWEYSFASWDPAMTAVTDDASYRAKYNATKREYIITFLDNDGTTILSAKNWKYGETPTCSVTDKNITGGRVTFNHWEPAVTSVTGIATYTAVRDTVWNTYNVFFFNESAFLTMTMVEHGKTPVYTGPTPTKASDGEYAYEFSGWTPSFTPLTGPGPYFFYATYNAIPLNFTVTFRNYDGTLLKTVDNVAANTPVDGLYTGATPTKPSDDQYHYQFDGWTPAGPATSTNKEFTAKYKAIPRKYGITWKNYDGTTLRVDSLEWHAFPFYSATPTRPDDENYSYKFKSWTPAVSQVVEDAVYTADFEHSGYVIHFVNYNGIELYRKAYVYGETPAYVGPTPTKPKTPEYSYRFNGWIPGIGKVLGPQTYKADFLDIANKYWLQWDPNNGELSGTYTKDSVPYNTPIVSPTITRVGYTFTGWTPLVAATMPAANTTYKATWQPNPNTPYVVEHYRQALDGTYPAALKEVENFTGTTASDVTPAVKSYTGFAAPPTETKAIAADGSTVVVYQYQRQSYTLTWVTDGDALKGTYTKGSVLYEAPITPPDTPTKTGYTFAGWNEAVADKMPATNKTYTAQWNANNYTITFDKQGGTDGSNSVVATYEKPMPSIVKPNRQGYIFDGYFTQPQSLGVMYYNSSVMSMRNWDIPSETTLYAAWRPRDDTPYKVNHYLQNLNNSDYTLYTTENHIGITDKQVTPAVKTYPGFTSPATQTITILPDGSAVVDYKYTRNRYNIQWLTDGDALTGSYTQGSVLYETPIVKPDTPKKTGYTFATWEPDVPLTMPAEDKTFTAKWNPNTNTPYVVKHYRQALDGTYPAALMETENLTGTTAASVTPAVKTYLGFTSPATKTVTIAADGSTVVEYYYTRNKYTLTWVTDGNALTGSYTKGSILFETTITEPNTP
ncbi:MAG: InlB B-repeat-containing protein, partial [Paludibacteraceae bacterium]|nr:InlB B-repeat-containing protein [Paludibacteraceae bacterium]